MRIKLKLFCLSILLILLANEAFPQVTIQRVKLNANTISAYFQNTGIFNRNSSLTNSPGFEWPVDSGKFAVFTTGLTIGAYVNNVLRMASASYKGEYAPGYSLNGVPVTNSNFKIYSVKRTDSPSSSDWANWGLMVPYGAPFVDKNNNGIYEPLIDTPGVKNSAQTLFMALTDGFVGQHTLTEGFGGGTQPLFADLRITAWCYSQPSYNAMQFIKFTIINKSTSSWDSVFAGIICDPDVGDAMDDYIGCDTVRVFGYGYNWDNNDQVYGQNPPAVGFALLSGLINKSVTPNINLGMTSFTFFTDVGASPPPCESDPDGEPVPAYHMLQGLKKDRSPYINIFEGGVITKFCYPGWPEVGIGWTEYKGSRQNCGGINGSEIYINPPGDRRFILGSGSKNLKILPGDTQTVVVCQFIARGTDNKNSVTRLKSVSQTIWTFYNSNFTIGISKISSNIPDKYKLHQNYPNPFNPSTKIRFSIPNVINVPGSLSRFNREEGISPNVLIGDPKNNGVGFTKLIVYDIIGREIATLINEHLQPGTYEVTFDGSKLTSGVYFYKLTTGEFSDTKRMILLK